MAKENPKAQITNTLGIDVDIYDVYNATWSCICNSIQPFRRSGRTIPS